MVRVHWRPSNNDKPIDFQQRAGTVGATTRDRFSSQATNRAAASSAVQQSTQPAADDGQGTNWVPWAIGGGIAVAGIATAVVIAMSRKR